MAEGLLTEEEVRSYLQINSNEIDQLVRRGKLTAYRVGGSYIRFRKDQVIAIKRGRKFRLPDQLERSWFDKVRDFWSFYSIYILLSILVILLVVYWIQS